MRKDNADMCLLYDFFGELLTERQRTCFALHYNDDLSLSEIAELEGITRQGVHVNIARAESVLMDFEKKTGIVSRFMNLRDGLEKAAALSQSEGDFALTQLLEELKGIV
jgi:predicted DNA-binding protein YlxM (UPF0122 family)